MTERDVTTKRVNQMIEAVEGNVMGEVLDILIDSLERMGKALENVPECVCIRDYNELHRRARFDCKEAEFILNIVDLMDEMSEYTRYYMED